MKEYFSHDYETRSDEKIIKLLQTHGPTGYGVFWMMVEMLYKNGGSLKKDYDLLAYEMRAKCDCIKSVCEDFGLFFEIAGRIHSESIDRRMERRAEKSTQAKAAAEERWYKNADAMRTQCGRNADGGVSKDSKEKNSKEKDKKEENNPITPKNSPKPETIIQYIVRQYKQALGVPVDDKDWDKARFPRLAKPAADIVAAFMGDKRYAANWAHREILRWKEWADKEKKSFSLERIAQAAQDAKGRYLEIKAQEEKDELNNGEAVGTDNSNRRGKNKEFTHIGNVATGCLDKIRAAI